jgi:hypothetical protein
MEHNLFLGHRFRAMEPLVGVIPGLSATNRYQAGSGCPRSPGEGRVIFVQKRSVLATCYLPMNDTCGRVERVSAQSPSPGGPPRRRLALVGSGLGVAQGRESPKRKSREPSETGRNGDALEDASPSGKT